MANGTMPQGRMPTTSWQKNSDDVEKRTRVGTYVDGQTFSYEDTDFTSADSPLVIDYFQASGRVGHKGYLINDGPGDIQMEISADGSIYGGVHTIKSGEQVNLDDLTIRKMRLTFVSDSAYRILLA